MSGFLLVLVHAFKGYTGWLNPAGWHSGLPPISLVAFVIFAVGFMLNVLGRE